ncbi:MAG TPA: MBL fold metallo-hydrolase [Candidatus Polarisedimenticolaceae bacterium]|nr:MBL fold metallo-hydrolase [Candidatus Polarisedimenticolaceae bacterium]
MSDELSCAELKQRLDRGDPLLLLDVRPTREIARFKIEAGRPLDRLELPYTRIVAEADDDDLSRATRAYAAAHLAERLPRDRPIVTVCAKGGASGFVAGGLRALGYPAQNLRGGMIAWGNHYDVRPAVEAAGVVVLQVSRPARGCISWIVAADGHAVVIDPLRHVEPYLAALAERGLTLDFVLDTHAHADHLSGGRELGSRTGAPYGLHPYDAIHPLDALPATFAFASLWEGWSWQRGDVRLEALHVPGHTLGHLAYLLDGRYLFSGDTVFLQSIARPDLGGRTEAWTPLHQRSLARLMALPDDTLVLPGHATGPQEADEAGRFLAPLGRLRESNAGLRAAAGPPEAFAAFILANLPEFPPQYVDIKRANVGLIAPSPEHAEELELGRNVCALAGASG